MAEEKKGFFRRLVDGLTKTRDNIVSGMDSIFNGFTHILMRTFMKNWRKSSSWAISEFRQLMIFWTN